MAGVSLRFDLSQTSEVGGRLNEVLGEAADYEQLGDEIGSAVVTATQIRFEREADPAGKPWKPTARGSSILKGSPPRLLPSITHRATRDSVEIGTNVIHAAVHQHGAVIRPKSARKLRFVIGSQVIFADKVEIPERAYLPRNAAEMPEVEDAINDHLSGAFR